MKLGGRYWMSYLGGLTAALLFAYGLVLSQSQIVERALIGLRFIGVGCIVSIATVILFWSLPKRT